MGVFSIFKKSRKPKKSKSAEEEALGSAAPETSSETQDASSPESDAAADNTINKSNASNMDLALKFVTCHQQHDVDGIISLMESNGLFVFEEAEMSTDDFKDELDRLFRSFPDFSCTWESIEEVEPGLVKVEKFRVAGTHTGEPYGFGPYEPVATSGIKVALDPEIIWLYMSNGVIDKSVVKPLGPRTGPPGFYLEIGGLII